MSSKTESFYDNYHKQNLKNRKIINRNNVTYWHIIRLIEKVHLNIARKKVLDIGCGVGPLSFYLSNLGAFVLGIDVSARAIALAKYTQLETRSDSVKFIHSSLSGTDDKSAPVVEIPSGFDLILCTEVIEHIADDKRLLEDCHAKLKKGGAIVITTQRNDGLLYKMGFFKGHDVRAGHFRRYDPNKLIKLIEDSGFKILIQQDADGLLRSILYTTRLGFLLKFVKGPINPFFQWLDTASIKIVGAADIQVVGIKK